MGPLVAGDVNSPLKSEGILARHGDAWVALPVDEVKSPTDGKAYVRRYKDATTTVWAVLPVDEAPNAVGKTYLRSGENGNWVEYVPPAVGEAPRDGKLYGRQYPANPGIATWVEVPKGVSDITAKDGKQYIRVFKANGSVPVWEEVVFPDPGVSDLVTKNGKMYARVFENNGVTPIWKEFTIPEAGVGDLTSKDGKQYARVFEAGGTTAIWKEIATIADLTTKDGKQYARVFESAGSTPIWKEIVPPVFDKYTLKHNASIAELDLSVAQVFSINATAARTLTFKTGTVPGAGRAMAVILFINGTGTITWPAGVVWNQSTQPVLGATTTLVTLVWVLSHGLPFI